MAGTELATAYVKLIPSLSGAGKSIAKQLSSVDTGSAGASMGNKLASRMGAALSSRLPSGIAGGLSGLSAKLAPAASSAGQAVGRALSTAAGAAVRASGAIASGVAAAGKAAATAAAAGAAAMGGLVASGVSGYADFEQNVGGVQKIFGDSTAAVVADARAAYKTAGIDQNAYMEQVTSFSASLKQSLGGDASAAAEYANRAIVDMADNANTYGTNIESIQDAYQGFAKQNYTMLDNLKLGYGGTQSEMERLIQDASKMTDVQADLGVTVDASSMSFGNIVNAISVMQASMGIAGTTSKEAATTISGSIGMMKAAWSNWLTVLAEPDGAIEEYTSSLVESLGTVLSNVVPAVQRVLSGVVGAIPVFMEGVGALLVQYGPGIVSSLASGLGAIGTALAGVFAQVVSSVQANMPQVAATISAALPQVVSAVVSFFAANVGPVVEVGVQLLTSLVSGLGEAVAAISAQMPTIVTSMCDALLANLPALVEAGVQLLCALVQNVGQVISTILPYMPQIVGQMVGAFAGCLPQMVDAGAQLLGGIASGIVNAIPNLIGAALGACGQLIDGVKGFFGIHSPSRLMRDEVGRMLPRGVAVGIEDEAAAPVRATLDMGGDVYDAASQVAAAKSSISAAGYRKRQAPSEGTVYNVYVNGARINDDEAVRRCFVGFMGELDRLGAI